MEAIQPNIISNISSNIRSVLLKIYNNLVLEDIYNSDKNNVEIYRILQNPKDEIIFNETVEFLKKNKSIKNKEISLSNNTSFTISIE